ncbi:MAG: putative RNA methyltransferase [Nitriliruptoraceae bacterium]
MIPAAVAALRCPHCATALHLDGDALGCERGHRFDLARQGYVNLVAGAGTRHTGDDAAMLDARERVLTAGLFEPLLAALAETADAALVDAPADRDAVIVDVGAGTGIQLARLVANDHRRVGIAIDVSKPAARRAAQVHPRVAAVLADAWQGLPVAEAGADLAVVAFAPRNGAELTRILAPHGRLLVAVPARGHLRDLRERLGLLEVDADKKERLAVQLTEHLELVADRTVAWQQRLEPWQAADVVAMGPSAHHLDVAEVAARLTGVGDPPRLDGDVRLLTLAHPDRR